MGFWVFQKNGELASDTLLVPLAIAIKLLSVDEHPIYIKIVAAQVVGAINVERNGPQ